MNYIDLINHYWQLREQGILTGAEGDLYMYLIHTSNKLGWKNPFNQSNALICAILNTSEPTLIRHRNTLKQVGLIEFESGKATKRNTQYYLNNFSSIVSSVVSSSISSIVSGCEENTLDNTKHKLNKTIIDKKSKNKFLDQKKDFPNSKIIVEVLPIDQKEKEKSSAKKEKKTVEERKEEFYKEIAVYANLYEKTMLRNFFDYWTEIGKNDKKMRFEKQGSWDLKKRLERWKNNGFQSKKNSKSQDGYLERVAKERINALQNGDS